MSSNSIVAERGSKIELRGWGIVLLGWATFVLGNLSNFALGMILPDLRAELGFGLQISGWLGAVGWLGRVFIIPLTIVMAKLKPKWSLQIIFMTVGAGMLLQGFATNVAMIFIGRIFVQGIGAALLTMLVLFKLQYIPEDKIQQVNGIEQFTGPAGQTMATVLIPYLMVAMSGWRNVMNTLGFITIALSIIWIFVCKDKEDGIIKKEEKIELLGPLKEVIKSKDILLVAFTWWGTTVPWISLYTFWPTYATETLGISMTKAGMVLGFMPIASCIAAVTAPLIAIKLGLDKPMLILSGLVLPFTYFAMINISNIPLLCIVAFISGYFAYAFVPLAFTVAYKVPNLSSKARSTATGFIYTFIGVGTAAGSTVCGILGEKLGLYKAIGLTCLTPFIFVVGMYFLTEYGEKAKKKKETETA